jgi:integrase
VLAALPTRWRGLFATAIYTGMRKGELLGLRKTDVDLQRRLVAVARSYDRDTTKGGHADVLPIAAELLPYLEAAIDASPSDLVFPKPDGTMASETLSLEIVLRRALRRAGIVTSYRHSCRRHGCGHREEATDAILRRCPTCNMKLWPHGLVRPIRFHHLRHTTASLLMMAGANPAAVQRIMRHSDPRLTTEVYGHLAPGYLRSEIDRLQLAPPAPESPRLEVAIETSPFGSSRSVVGSSG